MDIRMDHKSRRADGHWRKVGLFCSDTWPLATLLYLSSDSVLTVVTVVAFMRPHTIFASFLCGPSGGDVPSAPECC